MTKYTEKDISAFKRDTDKIRAKPALYIGPTDAQGVFTILREPCDNAVDEARAGRNTSIDIFIAADGQLTVADAGVGIPVKKHPVMKISTLTHVLTNLQSSGKMKKGAYDSAIGTHGVGIKATNALSSAFSIWTYRADEGGWHSTRFSCGLEKQAVAKTKAPKLPNGVVPKRGTVLQFTPDPSVFGRAKLPVPQVLAWAEMTAFMNAGLTIRVHNAKGQTKTFYSKEGIRSYLDKRVADLKAKPMSKKPLSHASSTLELALHFADVEGCEVEFFTNTIRNVELGVHADAFFRALVDSLKVYKGKLEFTPTDLREGLIGLLNYKINAPQFDSQTKEKLVDIRVKEPCYTECLQVLTAYWAANKTLAKEVCVRAAELRKRTAEFLKDKKLIRQVKSAKKNLMVKLSAVDGGSKVPVSQRELYIVEGDSAGGTASRARLRDRQAVWPLRGKILNVLRAKKAEVVANASVAGIFAAIGLELEAKDPLARINYGRIILMADPDVDGSHINVLLMTMLWTYAPDLIRRGHVYVLEAPEYLTRYKGKTFFGRTKEDLYKAAGSTSVIAQHIKGWGEISAADLAPAGMHPQTRSLIQIRPPSSDQQKQFQLLMKEDSAYRKQLLGIKL